MSKTIEYWIKRIPITHQNNIDLGRFKISLRKCETKTQIKKARNFLDYKVNHIFNNSSNFDKLSSQEYLKISLQQYIIELDNINLNQLNTNIQSVANKITIIDILDKAIETREKEYNIELDLKEKMGVDVDIKKDTTLGGYVTIKNHFIRYNLDKDYRDITLDDIEDFKYFILDGNATIGGVITYFKYLKAIFNRLIKANKITYNPVQVPSKGKLAEQEKVIFTYKEINTIIHKTSKENSLLFKVLLSSGMRMDELCSIKKKNIKNDNLHFIDSKFYFKKIVPIHNDILQQVLDLIEPLEDEDYLFYNHLTGKNRVQNVRTNVSKITKKYSNNKTLHKTRTTFISYLNYYNSNFSDKDIKSLTHKLGGVDDKFYAKIRNINNLKEIVNSIDFKKLEEIEELVA